jgi:hypothetical protein
MSEPSHSISTPAEPNRSSQILGFVLPLGGFLLFSLFSVYIIREMEAIPSYEDKKAAERIATLAKLRADEADKFGSGYGWVDSSKKIVRIPIDRAMEIVLAELQKKPVGAVCPITGVVVAPPVAPVPAAGTPPAVKPPTAK